MWERLAPLIAQRPIMRLSKDGGRSYPARYQRVLSPTVPSAYPAAVPTYDSRGITRLLVIDLDSKHGDVDAACRALLEAVHTAGGRAIVDESPNGGRHLYLPLQDPITAPDAIAVATAMAAQWPCVDPSPMRSVTDGLIRPPGSRHKTGGHQQLLTALDVAEQLLLAGNPRTVWDALKRRFRPTQTTHSPSWTRTADITELPALPGWTEPSDRYLNIARSGDWTGYPSSSEARQAVVWACVAAGWPITAIQQKLLTGAWPGLASLYAHKHPSTLRTDYTAAHRFEKHRRHHATATPAQNCNTRGQKTHAGHPSPTRNHPAAGYRAVREWINAVRIAERTRWADDPGLILVIRALAQAAQRNGSLEIGIGARNLSLAAHQDPSSVARHLTRLRDEPEPVIERIADAQGIYADHYRLIVPTSLEPAAKQAWRPGQTRALHPLFRILGPAAGFIWETLRQAPTPLTVKELVQLVPYSASTVRDELAMLRSWDLATLTDHGYTAGPAAADTLADTLGGSSVHRRLIERYRDQRRRWWTRLGLLHIDQSPTAPAPPTLEPPPRDPAYRHAATLITTLLGGVPLDTETHPTTTTHCTPPPRPQLVAASSSRKDHHG